MAAHTTTIQPASASPLKQVIVRHPLLAFFALAYACSWLITLPLLLGTNGLGLFTYTVPAGLVTPLVVIQTFGPAVAGLVDGHPHRQWRAAPPQALPAPAR